MKLYASDDSDLMEVNSIHADGGNLLVEGKIMGAIPLRAVLKPEELRKALKLMTLKTRWRAFMMLIRG